MSSRIAEDGARQYYRLIMRLHRSSRSAIALLTALLFVLCQAAFARELRASSSGSEHAIDSSVPPCHEGAGSTHEEPQAPTAVSSCCDEPKAVTAEIKPVVLAVTDLPVLTLSSRHDALRTPRLSNSADTHAVCYSPPPLNLLHCRFLN